MFSDTGNSFSGLNP